MIARRIYDRERDNDIPTWIVECLDSTQAASEPLCAFPKNFKFTIDLFDDFEEIEKLIDRYKLSPFYDKENKVMDFLIKNHWIDSYKQISTRTCQTTEEIYNSRHKFSKLQHLGAWYNPIEAYIEIENALIYERMCGICFYGINLNEYIRFHFPIINEKMKTWMKIGSSCICKFDYTYFLDLLTGEFNLRGDLPNQNSVDRITRERARLLNLKITDYLTLFNFFLDQITCFSEQELRLIFFANKKIGLAKTSVLQLIEFFQVFESSKALLPHIGDACYLTKQEKERHKQRKTSCVFSFGIDYDSMQGNDWNLLYNYVDQSKRFYFLIWRTIEKLLTTKRTIGLDFLQESDFKLQVREKGYLFNSGLLK